MGTEVPYLFRGTGKNKVMEVIGLLSSDNIKTKKSVNKVIRAISSAIFSILVVIHC